MTYQCLKANQYKEEPYNLVPLRREDIFLIMQWRNEQMDILRQDHIISTDMQQKYFSEVVEPTFKQEKPELILFSFLYLNTCIGYGGLTHIDWENKRGEVSFLVATSRSKKLELDEFRIFLRLLKKIAFDDLGFDELVTETYDIRPKFIEVIEEEGFIFQKKQKNDAKNVNSIFHTYRK